MEQQENKNYMHDLIHFQFIELRAENLLIHMYDGGAVH